MQEEELLRLQAKFTTLLDVLRASDGIWPLAAKVDVERIAQKMLNAARSFVSKSDTDVQDLEKCLKELRLPMVHMYDGAFQLNVSDDQLHQVAEQISGYSLSSSCHQSHKDLTVLYQVAVNVFPKFKAAIDALKLPEDMSVKVAPLKGLYRSVEKIILDTLSLDASSLKDVVRAMVIVPDLTGFPVVIRAFKNSPDFVIIAHKSTLVQPLDGWRDVKLHVACAQDPSSLVCEVQLVLAPLYKARSDIGGHVRYALLRDVNALHELKNSTSDKHAKLVQLEANLEAAVAARNFRKAADIQDTIDITIQITEQLKKLNLELAEAVKSKKFIDAAHIQDKIEGLDNQLTGTSDAPLATEARVPAASLLVNPKYPQLPLTEADKFTLGSKVNLKYPGLQLIHVSPHGSPFFLVHKFLLGDECDKILAKLSTTLVDSTAVADSTGAVAPTRNSKHVRITKDETPGLHARAAKLMNRPPSCIESAKMIRYTQGQEFARHFDYQIYQMTKPSGDQDPGSFVVDTHDGRVAPEFVNRELTLFIYLNDVEKGGETSFYDLDPKTHKPNGATLFSVKPERGMAVLFYATLQPPDGKFPEGLCYNAHNKCYMDPQSYHAGLPAVDEKYIISLWSWPPFVNRDASLTGVPATHEAKATDGTLT